MDISEIREKLIEYRGNWLEVAFKSGVSLTTLHNIVKNEDWVPNRGTMALLGAYFKRVKS